MYQQRLPLVVDRDDAVEAFLFYQASFLELAAQSSSSDAAGGLRQFSRYDEFMGAVLLGLISGFED